MPFAFPSVKSRPLLTATEENPVPTEPFQSRFGPSAGHEADQPVSFEMPLQSVPRQRGQSLAAAGDPMSAHKIQAAVQAARTTAIEPARKRRRVSGEQPGLNMAAELAQGERSVKH